MRIAVLMTVTDHSLGGLRFSGTQRGPLLGNLLDVSFIRLMRPVGCGLDQLLESRGHGYVSDPSRLI